MMTEIKIEDDDRRHTYLIRVWYSLRHGTQPRMGWSDGGSAGESPAVEIEWIELVQGLVWFGDVALELQRVTDDPWDLRRVETRLLEKLRPDIEAEVTRQLAASAVL